MSQPMTVRAFARALHVSHVAVRKAIASGRLAQSVGRGARGPVIIDVKLARAEWKAGAAKMHAAPSGVMHSLAEAQRAQHLERTRGLKFENDRRAGRYIEVREAELSWSRLIIETRTALLSVPGRLKSRCPDLTAEAVRVCDALIREALEALADSAARRPEAGNGHGGARVPRHDADALVRA